MPSSPWTERNTPSTWTTCKKILADIAGPRPAPATELLRPSLLPKLAQCPCYVSSPDAGEAAQRGTRMDDAFRSLLMGVDEFRACEHLKADEKNPSSGR